MSLFTDYIQSLTHWMQLHPNWSLFITFLVSLTESLAIIGSIIPGSVTMTAIGILAGSGIMRLDLTLLAAILGAIIGDSLSYLLGFYYSEQLMVMWPFRKYPHLLQYGKDYFSRHGGKSVLIGRFVGLLRPVIPVVAGIMQMKQWRFLLANIISAIGWSFLYIMPGVFIGAASHGLSSETATRLFLLILVILAGIWFISLLIKWLFISLHSFLSSNLHQFWLNLKTKPKLNFLFTALTPSDEVNHYSTAALLLFTLSSLLLFTLLAIFSIQPHWLNFINSPINLLMQSFHTRSIDAFFIICSQLTSTITLGIIYLICCFWSIYSKHYKTILYLTSLIASSLLIGLLLSYFIDNPRPTGLQITMSGSSFPALNIEIATAFFGFILLCINNRHSILTNSLRTFILIILGLSGLGAIYLRDYWFTDVLSAYFAGLSIALIHFLVYRKANYSSPNKEQSFSVLLTLFILIFGTIVFSSYFNFKTLAQNHAPYSKEYLLHQSGWWDQHTPILPIYRLNRVGTRVSMLNIQYSGNLDTLRQSLEQYGWETHKENFYTKLLMWMNTNANAVKLPLLTQLYENKAPELTMTYKDPKSDLILELDIWESNYKILTLNSAIWIGTIHKNVRDPKKKSTPNAPSQELLNPISYLIPALNDFTLRRIEVPKHMINTSLYSTSSLILLIKEP